MKRTLMPGSDGYEWLAVKTLTSSVWGSGKKPYQTTSFPTCGGKSQWIQKWYSRQWPECARLHNSFHFYLLFCFFSLSFLKGVRGDSFCVILALITSDPSYLEQSIEWWSVSELKYSTFKQCLHTSKCRLKRFCEQINNLLNYRWKWDILTGFFHIPGHWKRSLTTHNTLKCTKLTIYSSK